MPHYVEPVYRPPSEAASLIFQVTEGCSHNGCLFCYMYRGKEFRVKPWERVKAEIDEAAALVPHTRRVFLADGDAFVLPMRSLERILDHLYRSFPDLQRVTAYATPGNLLKKSVDEMKNLAEKGLKILYYGVETGDPELLTRIGKGATPDEMAEGCRRAAEAGLKLSITVILGIGGKALSERHARNTAALLNRIQPRFLSALTLMLGPYEREYKTAMGPGFELTSPTDDVAELRELVAALETDRCIFRSNHASNYLPLAGTLLGDKERLLSEIEAALKNPDGCLRDEWMRGL
ncbi:MAG: radical SAM protein [Candidatus Krumholzibacteria bacterium]|nr:radical SAM protein [Candidatus Krumholzibacteria bacterium]